MEIDQSCQASGKGNMIGEYKGNPIYQYIIDGIGRRFTFDRIVVEDRQRMVDLGQLKNDECIISPCLIYKKEKP